MNIWDVLILAGIALALYGAVRLYRGRKAGECSGCCAACGAGAAGCEGRKTGK